jgi:hypothetical protein
MSTRPGHPDGPATAGPGMDAGLEQAEVAISPATGPLPAIYVPQPGEADSTGLLWRATARSARRAVGWAARHLRRSM